MKTREEIIEVLKEARKIIKIWHDMGTEHFQKEVVWRMYENSPEIKRLDAMIEFLEQQPGKDSTPFTCPVCNGNGLVPNGFYIQTSGHWGTTDITPEKCQSCNGTGVVWKVE